MCRGICPGLKGSGLLWKWRTVISDARYVYCRRCSRTYEHEGVHCPCCGTKVSRRNRRCGGHQKVRYVDPHIGGVCK